MLNTANEQPTFRRTNPSSELSSLVGHFFEIDIPHSAESRENSIFPFAAGAIVFILEGSPRFKENGKANKTYSCFLAGPHKQYGSFVRFPLLICGVALKPTAIYKLFDIEPSSLINTFADLSSVVDETSENLLNELRSIQKTEQRFKWLRDFILKLQRNALPDSDEIKSIDSLTDHIFQNKGLLKVSELARLAGVSRRCLEKRFNKMTGLPPGQFTKQVRFHFAYSQITQGEPVNSVFKRFNYYDRSHFMKDVKKYCAPSSGVWA